MAANKWPLNRNLPDPARGPSYAHDPHWIHDAWTQETGRTTPTRVAGPFLPPDEMGRLMIALGRKTPPDSYMRSFR